MLDEMVELIINIRSNNGIDKFFNSENNRTKEFISFYLDYNKPSKFVLAMFSSHSSSRPVVSKTNEEKFAVLSKHLLIYLVSKNNYTLLDRLLGYLKVANLKLKGRPLTVNMTTTIRREAGITTNNQARLIPGAALIHLASILGHLASLRILLRHGADPSLKTGRNDGVCYSPPIVLAAEHGHKDCIQLLLDYHANANETDGINQTALLYAVQNGHIRSIELLLNNGADPNIACTFDDWTPLHHALNNDDKITYDLLVKHGGKFSPLKNSTATSLMTEGHIFVTRLAAP